MKNGLKNNIAFREKRYQLIEKLKSKGIRDNAVLKAMSEIPRERFVESAYIHKAYEDSALPIKCSQTISQPYTVAFMTELLNVNHGDKVLEIGTGSGYQASILYLLGAEVYSVERHRELYEKTRNKLNEFGFEINTLLGDGSLGWQENAPYDRIITTAGAKEVPEELLRQLINGGKLVIPIGDKSIQTMKLIVKIDEYNYDVYDNESFTFVPLIGEQGWQVSQ